MQNSVEPPGTAGNVREPGQVVVLNRRGVTLRKVFGPRHSTCVLHQARIDAGRLNWFNIAPRGEDTYDPEKWEGRILCSPPERAALTKLLDAGLTDCWRLFDEREMSGVQGAHRWDEAEIRPAPAPGAHLVDGLKPVHRYACS